MQRFASDKDTTQANLTAINTIMQNALNDFQHTTAMIIDVRANGGGDDAISLAIARYFFGQNRLAVSQFTRSYQGNTDTIDVYLEPADANTYTYPILSQ